MNEPGEAGESEVMDPNAKPEEMKDDGAGESALIPKSLLAGKEFNPGDELVLKIRAIHGDEVEVEYATEEKSGKDEEGRPMGKARMGMADRIGAMADM